MELEKCINLMLLALEDNLIASIESKFDCYLNERLPCITELNGTLLGKQ